MNKIKFKIYNEITHTGLQFKQRNDTEFYYIDIDDKHMSICFVDFFPRKYQAYILNSIKHIRAFNKEKFNET